MANKSSFGPSISSDGRFISFLSQSSNLVSQNASPTTNLFIYDRVNQTTRLIAEDIKQAKLSSNGRFLIILPQGDDDHSYLFDLLGNDTVQLLRDQEPGISNPEILLEEISSDGRYGSLISFSGDKLSPGLQGEGIFFYDRLQDQKIKLPTQGLIIDSQNGYQASTISGDGRLIAFKGTKINKAGNSSSPQIFLYNRVLGVVTTLPTSLLAGDKEIQYLQLDLSYRGNILAVQFKVSGEEFPRIAVIDLSDFLEKVNQFLDIESSGLSLSEDGKYLAVVHPSTSGKSVLSRYDLTSGNVISVDEGVIGSEIDISGDGSRIVFTKDVNGTFQVFLWEESKDLNTSYVLAGQVTDLAGYPLAQVVIHDDQGHSTGTDQDGYFWINGVFPGSITLKASKEGFEFKPTSISQDVISDLDDLDFIYTHQDTLKEAKKDLGMPYSKNRGSSGPFHDYQAGYCTDLILDAFTWGADFDIQFALEMDFKAHPWHFYRWRDARDAHDMWRYFAYSGQIQPHDNPYHPGDIVFFDWSQDGEIDHVALVSQVDSKGRPKMMYDATGVIDSNPSGLAAELEWQPFHEATNRGFARWTGLFEPIITTMPKGEILQLAVSGMDLQTRLLDQNGAASSSSEAEIIGSRQIDLTGEEVISITDDFSSSRYYLIVIINNSDQVKSYIFTSQFLAEGLITDRIEFRGEIPGNGITAFPIFYEVDEYGTGTIRMENNARRIEGILP